MEYIQTSYYNFINESKQSLVLYHGSPYTFYEFLPKTTFFSDDRSFAIDYSNQKSFEGGMDASEKLYTVQFNGNLFNANNERELKELSDKLPDKINYSYNNFGFTVDEDKEIFLLNLKGYDIVEPLDNIDKLNIGDEFPNPEYKVEKYVVIYKDSKYIYASYKEGLNRDLKKKMINNKEIKEIILIFYKDNEKKDNNYIPEHLLNAYIDLFIKGGNWIGKPPNNLLEEFKIIKKKLHDEVIKERLEKKYYKKFVLKPTKIELIETWRFYENDTVNKAIKDLGYDGYVAKENNKNTYAIFNPNETCKIKKYELPVGFEFKNVEEIKSYFKYDKAVANAIKNKENSLELSLKLNRFDVYRSYKKGISVDVFIKELLQD